MCKIWHLHYLSVKMTILLQNKGEKFSLWCKECTALNLSTVHQKSFCGLRLRPDPLGSLQHPPSPPSCSLLHGPLRAGEQKQWRKEKGEGGGKREGKVRPQWLTEMTAWNASWIPSQTGSHSESPIHWVGYYWQSLIVSEIWLCKQRILSKLFVLWTVDTQTFVGCTNVENQQRNRRRSPLRYCHTHCLSVIMLYVCFINNSVISSVVCIQSKNKWRQRLCILNRLRRFPWFLEEYSYISTKRQMIKSLNYMSLSRAPLCENYALHKLSITSILALQRCWFGHLFYVLKGVIKTVVSETIWIHGNEFTLSLKLPSEIMFK